MKILACVKQVPGTNRVEIDPVTGVLKRDGVSSKLNPYDLYSLETGFQLAEQYGGEVYTLTMGPDQAKTAIRETLAMGASGGTVISDRRFAGADVLATSYTLAQGVKRAGEFDLILCGKQTTDGDTAQVGPELAEHLGIPHVTNVLEVRPAKREEDGDMQQKEQDARVSGTEGASGADEKGPDGAGNGPGAGRRLWVRALRDGLIVEQLVTTPCLLCMEDGVNTPRLPSFRRQKAITEEQIGVMNLDDMEDRNEKAYGLSGSPTQVVRMFPPQKRDGKELWNGTEEESAERIFELLRERKMI